MFPTWSEVLEVLQALGYRKEASIRTGRSVESIIANASPRPDKQATMKGEPNPREPVPANWWLTRSRGAPQGQTRISPLGERENS